MTLFSGVDSPLDGNSRGANEPFRRASPRRAFKNRGSRIPINQHGTTPRPSLVDACRHLLQPNGSIIGRDVASAILPIFSSLYSAFPSDDSNRPAIASIDGRAPISHQRIQEFVDEIGVTLRDMGVGRGHRVAVVLPNGPELALAILAICNWASCVPLNANSTKSELEADLKRCGATLVMSLDQRPCVERRQCSRTNSTTADYSRFQVVTTSSHHGECTALRHVEDCAQNLGILYCAIVPSTTESGIFQIVPTNEPTLETSLETFLDCHSLSYVSSMLSKMLRSASRFYVRECDLYARETTRLLTPRRVTTRWGSLDSIDKSSFELSSTLACSPSSESLCSMYSDEESMESCRHLEFGHSEHDDEILVLFTSGSTGEKKLVPHTLGDMLVAAATIALSWNLTANDVSCNLMPLFHVGGIVRQLFAPILSGGGVICCPSFDPSIFWALLANQAFNWYYAVPTMHQIILQTGTEVVENNKSLIETISPRLRIIANAGGGLLPSTAVELRHVFQANVLPSYGMTECMPISSPPATYQLEKPGSSGVPVGPEVAIFDQSNLLTLPPGVEGAICVRGQPCFRGYGLNHLEHGSNLSSAFLKDGWFSTGDIGYVDSDGYVFITGRSKEVINRGGEIISPVEVEEVVIGHPKIQACVAFSVLHDMLQEVVGIAIVPVPGVPKLDLASLHSYLSNDRLATSKWPQCLVYIDDLPKSHTNKVFRTKLAQRLGLPELSDCMSPVQRTFVAKCPAVGTSLNERISCKPVVVDHSLVEAQLRDVLVNGASQELYVVPHPTRFGAVVAYVLELDRTRVAAVAKEVLDGFAVPSHICVLDNPRHRLRMLPLPKASDAVESFGSSVDDVGDRLVAQIRDLFTVLLNLDFAPPPNTSFFQLGGGSMLASQLASKIRKLHDISFNGPDVFHHATSNAIAQLIRERRGVRSAFAACEDRKSDERDVFTPTQVDEWLQPENNCLKSAFQLIPICILLPTAQVTRFFLLYCVLLWSFLSKTSAAENFFRTHAKYHVHCFIGTMALALEIFHLIWLTLAPLVFVVIKWVVIGKYKQGRFSLWSSYYLRWWFVDMCRRLIGRGIWGTSEDLLNTYYRMLGATIGKDACISIYAEVAEYDLVTIGESACIEFATIRPFGVDNGCMMLGPVYVGNGSSVGIRSVVAPFTSIPDETHLGPVATSYDVETCSSPRHVRYNRRNLPQPNLIAELFVGVPIVSVVEALAHIPTFFVLYFLIQATFPYEFAGGSVKQLMLWLSDARCIPFFIGIRLSRALVAPLVRIGLSISIKRFIIGKFKAGPRDTSSQWQLLRHWLAASLFSRKKLQEVADIVGRHYELVSVMYRMLGAKVGKRVFWPGHLPLFTGEFDLLEVGDDVVFGSRAGFFCSTVDSCEKVILCAGSNLSDNSFMMPGSILGKNSVLGSNSVCPEGWYLPEGSVWFGSSGSEPVLLEKGLEGHIALPILASEVKPSSLQMTGDATTLRPFGRAFYLKEAQYSVLSLHFIIGFTLACQVLIASVHTLPIAGALQVAGMIVDYLVTLEENPCSAYIALYGILLIALCFTHSLRVLLCFGIDVTAKWSLLGQRKPGVYNYDVSDYAQKWELYQILTRIRRDGRINLVEFLAGTEFMTFFFRLCGCKVGKGCCLYPAGGDPYMPEPDLVEIGDYCVFDTASIVCHLNTAGHFTLAKIILEDRITLRARSRIQQGVYMEHGSMLLEKSLAMTGEVVDADSVWQGAPASRFTAYRSLDKQRSRQGLGRRCHEITTLATSDFV